VESQKYTDDYRENLMRVIKAKMKGKKADLVAEEPPRDAKVIDLMERLRQSLDASSGRGRQRRAASSPRRGPHVHDPWYDAVVRLACAHVAAAPGVIARQRQIDRPASARAIRMRICRAKSR
jgi:hypothetical protein